VAVTRIEEGSVVTEGGGSEISRITAHAVFAPQDADPPSTEDDAREGSLM